MSVQNSSIDITRYSIISKVGEGAFSIVYRVKDLRTNIFYAAKVSNFMIDEETIESQEVHLLFREVNLMSLLNHPATLKFIGYYPSNFDEDPNPTIITELATNGSLRDIINLESQGLSPDEWNFTKKLINIYGIASGMAYLHANNVLHRDLKPENILIDDDLHPKICDFGLSKITNFLSISMNYQSQKGSKGTPAYMAPEILSEGKYSQSSDVYAFAFIVYQIITCEQPFKNFDIFKLMLKVMNEGYRPEISEDIPQVYHELIERCWSHDAKERPLFDQIVYELKNNNEFITDLVDETEFYDYVDFIDNYRSTFDVSKRVIHFSEIIQAYGRNKNVKPVSFSVNKEISNSIIHLDEQGEIIQAKQESNDNKEIDQSKSYNLVYPILAFNKLSKDNQSLVKEAENNAEKQLQIGQFLIEQKNDFPRNIKLGLQYIDSSINQKCNDAIVYYIKLLIKGKFIQEDLTKATEYLSKINQENDKRLFLLQGLIISIDEGILKGIYSY